MNPQEGDPLYFYQDLEKQLLSEPQAQKRKQIKINYLTRYFDILAEVEENAIVLAEFMPPDELMKSVEDGIYTPTNYLFYVVPYYVTSFYIAGMSVSRYVEIPEAQKRHWGIEDIKDYKEQLVKGNIE